MANLNISQFPTAGPLTGAELIGIMQAGVTKQTTAAALNNSATSPLPLGARSLSVKSANFANITAGAALLANYQFGSGAGSGPGITTIRNLTDLAASFNAFEDFTNLTSINSELERYQPFNSVNHVVTNDSITMQAANPNGDWQLSNFSQISGLITMNGTYPIAQLGLADTSKTWVGQMVAFQGGGNVGGNAWVTAIVPNVSVTFQALNGSSTTTNPIGLILWLPVTGVKLAGPYNNGGPSFNFASVPPQVTVGMAAGVYNSPLSGVTLNRSADTRITSISGNNVFISPVGANLPNLSAGTIIWFLPAITSGQIWSKLQIDLTNPQTFFAIEVDATLLGSVTYRTIGPNGVLTVAQYSAIPATHPMGGWPAIWAYSADDGSASSESSSASEIDFVEMQVSCTQDISFLNTGQVSVSGLGASIFSKNDSGWSAFAQFGIAIAPAGTTFVGRNLYRCIFTNGATYRFFNDTLYRIAGMVWNSQHPTQFSVGIAAGGLTAPLTANSVLPISPSSFANMNVAIHGIKVWYQSAGT